MQLSGLLDKIPGFLTKPFLVSAVLPLVCFVLINGAILAALFPAEATGIQASLVATPTTATFSTVLAVPALLCAAYVLSSFNLLLRQILEGKYLPWGTRTLFRGMEISRLVRFTAALDESRKVYHQLRADGWIADLRKARETGSSLGQCNYSTSPTLSRLFDDLEKSQRRAGPVRGKEFEQLEQAVGELKHSLETNNAALDHNPADKTLTSDQVRLRDFLRNAADRAKQAYIDAFNDKEFNFSRFVVAPTRMGNIAESIRSYAQSRYDINLDFIWTRLQHTFQQKSDFVDSVQDAKVQLDLMVASFWLFAGTTVFWIALIPVLAATWMPVIGVWCLGIPLTCCWYLAAVQAYLNFADLLRSSVDLFRLQLLTDLKIPLPANSIEESHVWDALNQKLCYGEDVLISYSKE